MSLFTYTAKSAAGESKTGSQEANSENELAQNLREQGLILTSTKQTGQTLKIKNWLLNLLPGIIINVPLAEKMMFARHLAVMVGAGLSLNRALEVLAQQTKSRVFAKDINDINVSVRGGASLADSMARHPKSFSELFVNMIKVGEASGGLENILRILAHQMEKEHELRSKVKSAMVYPIVIIIAMISIGVLMMVAVVPKLTQIFKDMKVDLPLSTKIIIASSEFLSQHLILGLSALIILIVAMRLTLKTDKGRTIYDSTILRLPIFGQISQKINSARLARTLGSLIEGGLPIVQGLQIVSDTMTNWLFRASLRKTSLAVQKGEKFSQNLRFFPNLYPPIVSQMVEVGEETGTLGEILLRLADFYEEEINDITKSLASIIEPVLMVVIGVVVGFFAIAMLQPMYSMMSAI